MVKHCEDVLIVRIYDENQPKKEPCHGLLKQLFHLHSGFAFENVISKFIRPIIARKAQENDEEISFFAHKRDTEQSGFSGAANDEQ